MNWKTIGLTVIVLNLAVFAPAAFSQETPAAAPLEVTEAAVATGIESLTPQGAAETFPSSVGMLVAYCRITGAAGEAAVKHLWFYGDRLMSEIRLPVKSPNWRTYSSKTILPGWTGAWRVDITDEDGKVLKTLSFTIE
jgi:Protein of unknown function (DUF2914)